MEDEELVRRMIPDVRQPHVLPQAFEPFRAPPTERDASDLPCQNGDPESSWVVDS